MNLVGLSQEEFERALALALTLQVPYSGRVHRDLPEEMVLKATPSAVLILFAHSIAGGPDEDKSGPALLFTRRADSVETHKGQMAFPGGQCDPSDIDGPVATALRETEEEVGIPRESVRVFGMLPSLVTATGFLIHPVVGILKGCRDDISLQLNAAETAEAIWIPLQVLLHPETYRLESVLYGTHQYSIDVFQVNHHRIWGATGSMTKNILDRFGSLE